MIGRWRRACPPLRAPGSGSWTCAGVSKGNVRAMQPCYEPLFIHDRVVEGHFECVYEVNLSAATGIERAPHDGIIPNR